MQVTEARNEGLKRELKVVIDRAELGDRFAKRVDEVKDQVRLKGFRPGKVPASHLKKVFGRSLMAEVVQLAVTEKSRQALETRNERPAFQPEIKFSEDEKEIEKVIGGEADLAFTMNFEVLPAIELADLKSIEVERPVAAVSDTEVDKAIERLVDSNLEYEAGADRAAETGDRVTIDFVGKIDGEAFEGGKAEDAPIVLGQGGFIPGFEEGLLGAKAGESKVVEATFPDGYPVANLAGKTAQFDVVVKEVAAPKRPALDDELAKKFGLESFDKLREAISKRIEQDYAAASRAKAKRSLLDALDTAHAFELPPTLVENEFKEIWSQLTRSLEQAGRTFADEGKTEEGERAEYQKLAERRVRLGLVLSEIGDKNDIKVTEEELARALAEHVRRFPGQERKAYDYFRKTPGALAQIRAPLYEEKVVTYVLELAKVTDKAVTSEELLKAEEDDELAGGHAHAHHHDHDHDHDHDHHNHDHDHHHGHDHRHD
ncbi:MAG: trigger factor [Hyphomicrobiaceae bacterium]